MTKYNHAYTLAFEAISDNPEHASDEEWYAGLMRTVRSITVNNAHEYCAGDLPFDTYEMTDEEAEHYLAIRRGTNR